jgi:anthranilate/para-aminobenzoate synthase component I
VVHDSIPEQEAEETRRKAETVLAAIAASFAPDAGGVHA